MSLKLHFKMICIIDAKHACSEGAEHDALSASRIPELSVHSRTSAVRYAAAVLPGVVLVLVAILSNSHNAESGRAQHMADNARVAATSADLRLGELLDLTSFCASAPALTERVDLPNVVENCGRYAERIGAWVVLVETGETHRHILNTRPDAPAVLPVYLRMNEHATLRALEERSRASGAPGIADVYSGIIYPGSVVSAGQYLRLADGRSAMLYVSFAAQTLSRQLAGLSGEEMPIFALIDASHRIVARSVGISRVMFAPAPDWIHGFLEAGAAGASLGVPGPAVIGGIWDAGYHPLGFASGWTAVALRPTPGGVQIWAPVSLPSALILIGLLLTGFLVWGISDRDRATRKVAAAQRAEAEAERSNRDKSRLLASFAHDIRTPLISLIGSLEMNEQGRGGGSDHVQTARSSAEALLQLIDDILELSFLGSGALRLHPSPVDLRQLALALVDQSRALADRKGLALQLDLDPELPVAVEVDRLRLQQVLSNLLTNALKYTETGSVTLRIRQAALRVELITLELAVIDTGIGLAPADIPRILKEFGRLEREAERREQGAGLGLAIVQRILNAMGASLVVESAPGQGSNFSFHLSLPVATGSELASSARPLSGVVILYAEDEPVIRQVTSRRLEEAGAWVICAVDGRDALRQLAAVTPDLLLIDLEMPGLNGAGLIRRLNELVPERLYPRFVLTSHISGPQAAEARAAGADAIFTKPIQVEALAAAFRARRGNAGHSIPFDGEHAHEGDVPVLDPKIFREVTELMGASAASSIIDRFEKSMRNDLSELQVAVQTKNRKRVGALAHRCLGLCQVIGAVTLALRLGRIEQAAIDGDMATVRALLDGTGAVLEATVRDMKVSADARPYPAIPG
jgi:signal transduction histidine kinase/DNA-binding response OmpR family regulator